MRRFLLLLVNLALFPWVFLPMGQAQNQMTQAHSTSPEALDSPRLAALARELKAGNRAALQRFWEEAKGKAPLVETSSGDDASIRHVTFLLREGDELHGITLIAPLPLAQRNRPLARFEGTDLWFLTLSIPAAARFSYAFQDSSGKQYGDPLNPLTKGTNSMAELPDAPPQPWIRPQPEAPKGTLTAHKIQSEILKEERAFSVYTPAGYDPQAKTYGLLVVFDGEAYRSLVPTPTVLDNLIASRKIIPLVAILIDSDTRARRNRDLYCHAPFADFVAQELIPWVHQNYHLKTDPKQTIVCGSSAGGLSAAYCALRHPEVFGNVLSQSGAFYYYPGWKQDEETTSSPFGWLTRQFVTAQKLPIRFYLEAGLFETSKILNLLSENRRLRDVLEAKGYPVVYSEFAGGHEYFCWRGSLADGLIALAGREK